jgi:hypothetical protein
MGWLGVDAPNIAAGWGPPPQLHAAPISGLVEAIMRDRLVRQKMGQENISETIKNIQAQRAGSAYLAAAKNAGLIPESDLSGAYGAKYGESLADTILKQQKLEQDQREAEALQQYRSGMLGVAQGRLDQIGAAGGDGEDIPEVYTDKQGREWRRTKTGWTPLSGQMQTQIVPQKTAEEQQAQPAYTAAQEAQTEAEKRKALVEKRFGAPVEGAFPGLQGGKKARVEAKYLRRLQEATAAQKVQQELSRKFPGLSAKPGADTTVAPGYGQAVSDADVQALAWAKANPNDPRSAAILRKLGLQ